jgi:hypothetical protein
MISVWFGPQSDKILRSRLCRVVASLGETWLRECIRTDALLQRSERRSSASASKSPFRSAADVFHPVKAAPGSAWTLFEQLKEPRVERTRYAESVALGTGHGVGRRPQQDSSWSPGRQLDAFVGVPGEHLAALADPVHGTLNARHLYANTRADTRLMDRKCPS